MTLNEGFSHFWDDAKKQTTDYKNLRQAFKNGAAFIDARLKVRGPYAIIELIDEGAAYTIQQMWPWICLNQAIHVGWDKDVYRDAIVAGGFAALLVCDTGHDLGNDLAAFQVTDSGLD